MLDTDIPLLKGLVPPKLKPPPWLPLRINWRHPLARDLHFVQLFTDSAAKPLLQPPGLTSPTLVGAIRPSGPSGIGLATDRWYVGGYDAPTTAGTAISHVRVGSGTSNRSPFGAGRANFASGPTVELAVVSSTLYGGWWSGGSDTRASVSISGLWSDGDIFTLGIRWSASAGTQIFNKGRQVATNATAPATGATSTGGGLLIVANQPYLSGPWHVTANDAIYYHAFWSRALETHELLTLENDPYCFFEPDIAAPWFLVSANNTYNENVSDSLTLTDSASAAAIFGNSVSDSLTMTDAASAALIITESPADSLSLSDSVTSTAEYNLAVDDTLTLSDAASYQAPATDTHDGDTFRRYQGRIKKLAEIAEERRRASTEEAREIRREILAVVADAEPLRAVSEVRDAYAAVKTALLVSAPGKLTVAHVSRVRDLTEIRKAIEELQAAIAYERMIDEDDEAVLLLI